MRTDKRLTTVSIERAEDRDTATGRLGRTNRPRDSRIRVILERESRLDTIPHDNGRDLLLNVLTDAGGR